jgi:hypothetical protein
MNDEKKEIRNKKEEGYFSYELVQKERVEI